MLSRRSIETLVNTRSADVLSARCEHKFPYCRRLRDAIDTSGDVAEKDSESQCRYFDELYVNTYLMRGRTHRSRTLEPNICHRAAVHNPLFVGWPNSKMSAVLLKHC